MPSRVNLPSSAPRGRIFNPKTARSSSTLPPSGGVASA